VATQVFFIFIPGEMIQFNVRIFFQMGWGTKPPTSHDKSDWKTFLGPDFFSQMANPRQNKNPVWEVVPIFETSIPP